MESEYREGQTIHARQHVSFRERRLHKVLGRLYELDRQGAKAPAELRAQTRRVSVNGIAHTGRVKQDIVLVEQ